MDLFPELRLERTLEVLSTTDNNAAAIVLLEALVHAEPRWQSRVLEALLQRRSEAAGNEVLRRWSQLGANQKLLVAGRSGWISDAVRAGLASTNEALFEGACLVAREVGDCGQIPYLVAAVFQGRSAALVERACQTVLPLVDRLREELNQSRDYRTRRSPQLQRAQVLGSLERAVRQFNQHGRRELVEALLLVADRRNATVSHVLRDPSDRAFAPLLDVLATSARSGIQELLLDYLDDPLTPLAALHAMMRRRDVTFVRLLCRKVGAAPTPVVRSNLKRLENIPLLRQPSALLQMLDPAEQAGAVQLAICSSVPRQLALELIRCVLQEGSTAGRRCAASALGAIGGPDASAVAMQALGDDDAEVKAAIARQLRPRDIPDALLLLVSLLHAPQALVREAARECLADITFDRYLERYDSWDEETRIEEGRLLLRVDPHCIGRLVLELQSPSRSRQRRALEITQLLGLAGQVEPALAELAVDEDQFVRLEAVRLLASLATPLARELLRVAAHDKSALVQEAARQAWPEGALAVSVSNDTVVFRRELAAEPAGSDAAG